MPSTADLTLMNACSSRAAAEYAEDRKIQPALELNAP
jgi:hypothetical protein